MPKSSSIRSSSVPSLTDVELNTIYFDPNDRRYRCCCQQFHSTVGVKIIAALLCVTVLLEVWSLIFYLGSTDEKNSNVIISSGFQILVGAAISASVLYALKSENAAFLSPYLLLQTVGLAAGFVIFFALIYITAANDLNTIKTFIESHGPKLENDSYLIYMGWTMVGSCVAVLGLQLWLISIVFACWRYYRDKREYGYSKGHTSSLVVLRPVPDTSDQDNIEFNGYTVLTSAE
ncbi:unnamed protein product [Bursaphelenchus xylophilus]|uniref:(pine wood nematode) hypothetical protein n=1 Tax=Bursaphelenchus xylophilus TaxID=6326 RepID=A0A1I7RLK2_BURXY|nr:unnamed protein product [Bursaphelenchus xylophilus]CAG9082899.1 unnamed protein product [Bursaphelenchus xylophilus]